MGLFINFFYYFIMFWYSLTFSNCWGLVLKCYELGTRQHRMLDIKALRPLKHYFPKNLMSFGRRL
jgi:hypothetical protein